jgi:hypothetical protein
MAAKRLRKSSADIYRFYCTRPLKNATGSEAPPPALRLEQDFRTGQNLMTTGKISKTCTNHQHSAPPIFHFRKQLILFFLSSEEIEKKERNKRHVEFKEATGRGRGRGHGAQEQKEEEQVPGR